MLAAGAAARGQEGAGPEEVRAKAREVLADPRFQRELPPHAVAPTEPITLNVPDVSPVSLPVLGAAVSLVRLMLYVFLAVALVLIGVWLAKEIVRRRRPATVAAGPEEEVPGEGERPKAHAVPGDATRLAAAGRYGEAIHVLLLVTIRHLAERARLPAEPARTSRELIRLLPLKGEGRQAFEALVRAVELTLFGGQPAGAEDWERSLVHFQRLTGRSA